MPTNQQDLACWMVSKQLESRDDLEMGDIGIIKPFHGFQRGLLKQVPPLCRTVSGWRGIRVGEASNPGPNTKHPQIGWMWQPSEGGAGVCERCQRFRLRRTSDPGWQDCCQSTSSQWYRVREFSGVGDQLRIGQHRNVCARVVDSHDRVEPQELPTVSASLVRGNFASGPAVDVQNRFTALREDGEVSVGEASNFGNRNGGTCQHSGRFRWNREHCKFRFLEHVVVIWKEPVFQ